MPSVECKVAVSGSLTESFSAANLFARIVEGDESACEVLYRLIGRTVRATVQRDLQDDYPDIHHNLFLDVIAAIKAGSIRKPDSLLSFVRTICRRQRGALIQTRILQRQADSDLTDHMCEASRPDEVVMDKERARIAFEAIQRLPEQDRCIVEEFYLSGFSKEQVMARNGLTSTQYRLRKSRAVKKLQVHAAELDRRSRRALFDRQRAV